MPGGGKSPGLGVSGSSPGSATDLGSCSLSLGLLFFIFRIRVILDVLWGFPAQTKATQGDEVNRLWSHLAYVLTQPCCSLSLGP